MKYMKADPDNPELPSEIICSQILPRLPSKSLMRFKCVCKSWSSLIRNPSFVNAHRHFQYCRNSHTHLLLMTTRLSKKLQMQRDFFSVQTNQEGISTQTHATHLRRLPNFSCHWNGANGLICLEFSTCNPKDVDIYNPSTREYITLPVADSPTKYPTGVVSHWMGFSPLTNEYKVLRVNEISRESGLGTPWTWSYMFQIFTLGKSSSWRQLEFGLDLHDLRFQDFSGRRSVYVNGARHWIDEIKKVIVAFDFEDERFRMIPIPDKVGAFRGEITIVEAGGCVAAAVTDNRYVRLWILKDYQNQVWVTETTNLTWDLGLEWPKLLGVMRTGELLLQHWGHNRLDVRVLLYNIKSKILKMTQIILPEWIGSTSNDFELQVDVLGSTYDEDLVPLTMPGPAFY